MIEQLPAAALQAWLHDTKRDPPLILDVRERWEYEVCRISQAQSIPMQEITERIADLPQRENIVVVCHHGMRSLQVAQYLESLGFTSVYNLSGGIAAWADQVEPAMPRY